jgi:hypothetical protein
MVPEETVTPVPDKATVGELDAVLTKLTLPVLLPAAVGANTTVNAELWPAAKVSGSPRPVKEYPVPLAVAAETVRLAPEAVSVIVELLVLPIFTLPKASEAGLTFSVALGGATPAPVSETSVGLLEALLVKEICPETLPTEDGAKRAV